MAIRRNRELLLEAGMDANKQDTLWKGLKGVGLLARQKTMIAKYGNIPNRKGGPK